MRCEQYHFRHYMEDTKILSLFIGWGFSKIGGGTKKAGVGKRFPPWVDLRGF